MESSIEETGSFWHLPLYCPKLLQLIRPRKISIKFLDEELLLPQGAAGDMCMNSRKPAKLHKHIRIRLINKCHNTFTLSHSLIRKLAGMWFESFIRALALLNRKLHCGCPLGINDREMFLTTKIFLNFIKPWNLIKVKVDAIFVATRNLREFYSLENASFYSVPQNLIG